MKNLLIYSALGSIAFFTSCGKDDFDGSAGFTYSPETNIKVGDTVGISDE